jgi:hypothetical protein
MEEIYTDAKIREKYIKRAEKRSHDFNMESIVSQREEVL